MLLITVIRGIYFCHVILTSPLQSHPTFKCCYLFYSQLFLFSFRGRGITCPFLVCLSRDPLRLTLLWPLWGFAPLAGFYHLYLYPLLSSWFFSCTVQTFTSFSYLKIALKQASPLQLLCLKIVIYTLFLPFLSSHSFSGLCELVQPPLLSTEWRGSKMKRTNVGFIWKWISDPNTNL